MLNGSVSREHKGECADALPSTLCLLHAYLDRRTCDPHPTSDALGKLSRTSPPESSTPGQGSPGHLRKRGTESCQLPSTMYAHGCLSTEGRGPRATRTPQLVPWWATSPANSSCITSEGEERDHGLVVDLVVAVRVGVRCPTLVASSARHVVDGGDNYRAAACICQSTVNVGWVLVQEAEVANRSPSQRGLQ